MSRYSLNGTQWDSAAERGGQGNAEDYELEPGEKPVLTTIAPRTASDLYS
ncbi:hypothetical protein ACFQFS_12055 [Novosphingobium lubricantis]